MTRGRSQALVTDVGARAAHALSAEPRAFLRWAGSKRNLLTPLVEVLPDAYAKYYEPFLGSGSLFFLLQPKSASLSDSCEELIDSFTAVRDGVGHVLRHLRPLKLERSTFYEIRGNRSTARYKRAAEFIYLNKACWNGLYRVNSRGEFNVPYGLPKSDFIVDESNLRACATALGRRGVSTFAADFEVALASATAGDLVFLDPPYVTKHNDNGFIDYNERLFSWDDQIRLARVARELAAGGVHVLVTNAFHHEIFDLYPGFSVTPLDRASTLAANAAKRGRVREALIWRHARNGRR